MRSSHETIREIYSVPSIQFVEFIVHAEIPSWNNDRSNLDAILMEESIEHARSVFDEFKQQSGIEIEEAIDDNFDGNKGMGYKQLSK